MVDWCEREFVVLVRHRRDLIVRHEQGLALGACAPAADFREGTATGNVAFVSPAGVPYETHTHTQPDRLGP